MVLERNWKCTVRHRADLSEVIAIGKLNLNNNVGLTQYAFHENHNSINQQLGEGIALNFVWQMSVCVVTTLWLDSIFEAIGPQCLNVRLNV